MILEEMFLRFSPLRIMFALGLLFSSVQLLSHVQPFMTPCTEAFQASLPSPTPRPYSRSCWLSWWCHPTISSSVVPFSSRLQSFPASGSFQMSQFWYMIYGHYYAEVISIYVHFLKSLLYMGAEFCQKLFLRLLSFLSVSICSMYWGAPVLDA